ncbi:MAG: AAA family ATPase, partial [Opitutales bacterium]
RRLNIAVSLLHDPPYLLCDEPTVGVDPQSRNAIFEFLESQRARGLTIIYTTHYMEEAERLCDRIAIIDHGRIIAEGTRRELVQRIAAQPELRLERVEGAAEVVEETLEDGYVWSDEGDEAFIATLPEGALLSVLYARLEQQGLSYDALAVRQPSLENLFLHLTGRRLRE